MATVQFSDSGDALTCVALTGRLDVEGVQEVELAFTTKVGALRRPTLVDLSRVEFLASLGMGMILGAAKALRAHGVRMVLVSPQPLVEKTLRAGTFDRLIPIADDDEAARELLSGPDQDAR